jgi:hypothetical protein
VILNWNCHLARALAVVVVYISLDTLLRLHDSVTTEWVHLESKCGTKEYQRLLVK